MAHRLSGVALAAFLPVHFWALGTAMGGAENLDAFLILADHPLVKFAEWGLVVLLALHLLLGLRVLLIEGVARAGDLVQSRGVVVSSAATALLVGLLFWLSLLA
ncbi:MAG: succinate dehydrogenase [Geminicoccaceae bacterium]|nr:succinate dehydrogenase [Geminicoccaceae bacterium]